MADDESSVRQNTTATISSDLPLDLDFTEFDDKEFDIPSVETVPTLESILNAPDIDSVLDDEDLPVICSLVQSDSLDTSSSSSHESQSLQTSDKAYKIYRDKDSQGNNVHGSVLRPSKLKNISAQIISAADRVDAGMPTAMAVSQLIAIGTSHGLVLIFDPKQVLKWCLGSTAVGAQYGSVSALSFNIDCTRLLSGFAKGQITMWDLTNGKLLRTITDAHPLGSAVLHVKFTDSFTLAVCSDSGGSVFELGFKRLIGVRTTESRCLFSGSRGEVCVVEPLHMNYTIKDHPMQDVSILAMASLSKVLLVTLSPQLKVMFTHSLKGGASTLPLLAWQFVIIQVSEVDRVIDPVLALARDTNIFFYQVICQNPQNIKCQGLQKISLQYSLLSIKWMNARTLLALDTTEKIHVIDVRSEEELEVIDISDIQLVYGSSHFKSLATGGNVSQALAYAGEQSCYQSLECFTGQLFILGTKSIHVLTLRTWRERIDVLVKQNKYCEALALALSFYEGRAKAVIGLTGAGAKKREIVADLMLDLLFEFVDLSMTQFCPSKGKIEELEEYYQEVVPVCVDYCLHLGRTDILFGRIYERFSADVIAKNTFLECLEPYILDDKLTAIVPFVMKEFIEAYEGRGMLGSIEACIVHLDVGSLDIHQIVSLCWKHALYDAIIYVYNKGMQDYCTPLEELLGELRKAVCSGIQLTDSEIRLGNKLLVYVSCCLAGRAYPLGDIPEDIVTRVKQNVFLCMTSLHTKEHAEDEAIYPHLRTLLRYNTPEFLNVLALAFEEEEFNTEEGREKRQRLVDILLEVMVEGSGFTTMSILFTSLWFPFIVLNHMNAVILSAPTVFQLDTLYKPTQVGMLFTFLARQMSRHENTIFVKRSLFEQVLEFLSNPGNESRHEERQQALLDLLNAGGLQQFDEDRLLHLAHTAKFYHVCELLHERRREFDKILACYLIDPSRQHRAFDFIAEITQGDQFSKEEKSAVRQEAMSSLQELVGIDCEKAAHMVIDGFSQNLLEIVNHLKPQPELLLNFLHGVLLYWEASGSAVHPERQVPVQAEVFEEYIDLLCRYKPAEVCHYVKTNAGYRLEQALQICRRYKIPDALAFLLEKAGDVQGAFRIMLETLQGKLRQLHDFLVKRTTDSKSQEADKCLSGVHSVLLVIIQLCQRNSARLDEAGREALWFPLLEAMMSPQRKMKDSVPKAFLNDYKELTHHVLNSMMGYIALPAILQKIMQDPAYNAGKFGEVKELILGMLETYNYEQTLMMTCKNLMYHDLHTHLSNLTRTAVRGYVPRTTQCNICSKRFTSSTDSDTIIVFRCGHCYHTSCLHLIGSVHHIDGEEIWACYLCSNSKHSQRLQTTRLQQSATKRAARVIRRSPSPVNETLMDPQQMEAFENFRRCMRSKSRLQILTELSRSATSPRTSLESSTSILQNEKFKLCLAPGRHNYDVT